MPRGRPRKTGLRERNGRVQRIHRAARDAQQIEMKQVISQPHRRGNIDQQCESPLGRFCLRNKLDRAIYVAGISYGSLVRFYLHAKAVRVDINEGVGGSGAGVASEKAQKLAKDVWEIDYVLRQINPIGLSAVKDLAVFEREIHPSVTFDAIGVLTGLARHLRLLPSERRA
jgi:hypothetical protein